MIGVGIGLGLSEFRLAPASFSPVQISGLQLWLDASDSSTLYQTSNGSLAKTDGDPVGQWRDKSGNARHVSQSDGTRKPALKTAIKNGKNAVRFDGVNDYFRTSNAYNIGSVITMFIVAIRRSGGDSIPYLWDMYNINGGGMLWQLGSGNAFAIGASGWVTGSTVANDSSVLACGIYNGTNLKLIQNGTSYSGSATGTTFNLVTIGDNGILNRPASGDFCEMIWYSGALSDQNQNIVIQYLNKKWSVY